MLMDPNNPNVIIVATTNGIYRSSDGGSNFVYTYSNINMTVWSFILQIQT